MGTAKSILRNAKMRFLPPSSRSFHDASERVIATQGALIERLDRENELLRESQRVLLDELHDLRGWMYDEMERHDKNARTRDEHAKLYLEALYRKDGESHRDARKRLFAGLEPATGPFRILQLATARIMSELDAICERIGIEYWFAYGTLVATLYRQGAIPWDDDIDICMWRSDIERLKDYLDQANQGDSGEEGDMPGKGFKVTTVFDRFVYCRQVRFSSLDPLIPCFIDLSIWDGAPEASPAADEGLRALRLSLMQEFEERICAGGGVWEFWNANPYLRGAGSLPCAQAGEVAWDEIDPELELATTTAVEEVFATYQKRAIDAGLLFPDADAGIESPALAYGLDNVYDAPWRRITWPRDLFFPTHKMPYESYRFSVPHREQEVCDECYPDSPYLPSDIFDHSHIARTLMDSPEALDAMRRFLDA